MNRTLEELGWKGFKPRVEWYAVKEAVFPLIDLRALIRFRPEMKSTGEVMGIDKSFELAF